MGVLYVNQPINIEITATFTGLTAVSAVLNYRDPAKRTGTWAPDSFVPETGVIKYRMSAAQNAGRPGEWIIQAEIVFVGEADPIPTQPVSMRLKARFT